MRIFDAKKYAQEICETELIRRDEERYAYDEFEKIVTECVEKVYKNYFDGEVDDWDYFDYLVLEECEMAFEK